MTIREIIELIESDGKIMDYRLQYSNLPIWPLIRSHVLANITEYDNVKKVNETIKKEAGNLRIFEIINKLLLLIKICIKSIIYNKGKLQGKSMFVIPNRAFLREDIVHENIYGFFTSKNNETLYLKYYDDMYRWHKTECDAVFREAFFPVAYIKDSILGKKKNKYDVKMAYEIAQFILDRIGSEYKNCVDDAVLERVGSLSRYVKSKERVYEYILKKSYPKYVLISCCSYSYYAADCWFFKKNGIPTIEIQHGMIHKDHHAYVCSKVVYNNSDFNMFIPDYIFTWSDYWSRYIKLNTKIISVGNPEFYYSYRQDFLKNKEEHDNIVILYNIDTDFCNITEIEKFIYEYISNETKDVILRLRFHPACKQLIPHFKQRFISDKIVYDDSEGVYVAFSKVDYLVTCFSTIAYEALACGIEVLTDHPNTFGDYQLLQDIKIFASIKELMEIVCSNDSPKLYKDYKNTFFGEEKDCYETDAIIEMNEV